MSRAIRRALEALGGLSVPDGPAGVPPIPPGRGLPPPPGGGRNLPPPADAPPTRNLPGPATRNLPGPVAPDAPSTGGGWGGAAARVGLAVAAGGGLVGAWNALNAGGNPPAPPTPPAPPPAPPIDPKTATREELLAAGYRDYGGGWVNAGAGAPQQRTNGLGVPDDWRRKMFLKQQANRYRHEIAKNPALYSDMAASYDQGGGSHSARAVATRALTDHLDAQKAAQIGINVDNAAKQTNLARQMGVPRGYVQAMDDVAAHAARGDLASASAAAAMYGQVYGQSFLYAARNLTDQHSASERAKGELANQKPPAPSIADSVKQNMDQIGTMPPGAARKAAIESFHQQRFGGDKADAKQVKVAVENHYQPIVKDMATRLDKLSPEEMSELQQVAGHMNYQQFIKYAGLTDTPDAQRHFQRIFNKNATWGQWYQNLTPWDD